MDDESDRHQSGQSLLLASSLATLVLAGSAVLLRSKLPNLRFGNDPHSPEINEEYDAAASSQAQHGPSKNHRSKERRRRGKDPMKELMKGGKKAAKLLKTIDQGDSHSASSPSLPASPAATQTHHHSQLPDSSPSRSKRSRSPDASVSSRSVSSASVSSSRRHVRIADIDQDDFRGRMLVIQGDEDLDRVNLASKDLSGSQRPPRSDSHYTDSHYIYSTYPGAHSTHSPSHCHSTSHDSTPSSTSAITSLSSADSEGSASTAVTSAGSTSPVLCPKPYEDEDDTPSVEGNEDKGKSTATGNHMSSSKSYPSKSSKDSLHNANDTFPSRKPPRFRTRKSTSSPQPDIPSSTSLPPITSTSTLPSNFTDSSERHDAEIPVSMDSPNLTGSINKPRYRDRERTSSAVHVSDFDHAVNEHGSAPRHAPTPRRIPTPSTVLGSGNTASGSGTGSPGPGSGVNSGQSTPPQSQSASSASSTLSTQTQIASLRGALEAARMREEKTKVDLDRCVKEVEMLRWESSTWRRRESELHNHIHHLMHQLQSYSAFYMSSMAVPPPQMQSPPNATQHPQHLGIPGRNGSPSGSNSGSNAPSPNPNGHQQVPLPSSTPNTSGGQPLGHEQPPSAQQQPMTLDNGNGTPINELMTQQLPSPPNGLPMSPISPLGLVSPLSFSMLSSPHSPQFPYPPYPMAGPSHIPGRSPYGMPMHLQMHPSPFPSMLNTMPASTSSGLPMGPGEDDLSSDPSANNSPSPGLRETLDRGRKKMRSMASPMDELGDGWVGVGILRDADEDNSASGSAERYDAEGEDEEEEDNGGVSELLADAILKRPGSIRLGSGKKKGRRRDKPSSEPEDEKGNTSSSPPRSLPDTPGSSESQNSSEAPVEFVFPSISDWGNVTKKKADVAVEPSQGAPQEDATSKGLEDDITPPASGNAQVPEPTPVSLPDSVAVTGDELKDSDS